MTVQVNEETPLLIEVNDGEHVNAATTEQKRTPLPKGQIAIALLLFICDPIMSSSIYPYINQLVSELDITGGDPKKTGYYAGMIESLFFITQAATIFHWSRLSDRIGRKPVVLFGTSAVIVSIVSFGLSKSFWALILSRGLVGAVNGNVGVFKTMFGDLTDSTNRAEAFVLFPVSWSIGATVGPYLGGMLARPHDRFPNSEFFARQFWIDYPYSLPCFVTAGWAFLVLITVAIFMKETNPRITKKTRGRTEDLSSPQTSVHKQLSTYELLKHWPVFLTVTTYGMLAFLNASINALFPLFFSMKISIGGLGLPPSTIGSIIGTYGAVSGIFLILYFPKLVRRFHEKKLVLVGLGVFIPIFLLMPTANAIARRDGGMSPAVWVVVCMIMGLEIAMELAYGAISLYITTAAPTPDSLGAANGLGQTFASISRSFGPALSTSAWALSAEKNWMGGNGVYFLWSCIAIAAIVWAMRLPARNWHENDEQEMSEG